MTDDEKLRELLRKRMDDALSPSEEIELDDLLSDYSEDELADIMEDVFAEVTDIDPSYYNHDWEAIRQKIVAMPRPDKRSSSSRFLSFSFLRYAAAILVIAVGGAVVWWASSRSAQNDDTGRMTGLKPDTAHKSDQELICGLVEPSASDLKKDSRIVHLSIRDGIHTLSISPGWQFHTTLPDGSTVVLNAASSVSYPVSFEGFTKREVQVKGEVFFDVAQNARQPFFVKAGNVVLQALGTSFNVNAYGDKDSVYATLVSGSLRVRSEILKPGEQAAVAINDSASIKIDKANLSATGKWREGYFSFNQSRIDEVMSELSRWYKWEISYAADATPRSFSGTFCRRTPEAEILQTLRNKGIRFQKTGNKLLIQ